MSILWILIGLGYAIYYAVTFYQSNAIDSGYIVGDPKGFIPLYVGGIGVGVLVMIGGIMGGTMLGYLLITAGVLEFARNLYNYVYTRKNETFNDVGYAIGAVLVLAGMFYIPLSSITGVVGGRRR